MKQPHMSLQLYKRCARFLYSMKQCRNYIVRACFTNVMYNARIPLDIIWPYLEINMELISCVMSIIIV